MTKNPQKSNQPHEQIPKKSPNQNSSQSYTPPLNKAQIHQLLKSKNSKWDFSSLSSLPHPFSLKDCEQASHFLAQAIANQKQILVVGDYDVDGIVSSAIMMRFLHSVGHKNATYIIPNRFRDGYGISQKILQENPSDIVITVDNGISAFEAAQFCTTSGRRLIITDHHLPKEQLPNADFIINPQRHDCEFPQKEICGALVAWYLCAGTKIALQKIDSSPAKNIDLAPLLEFVALATIADMMPLKHINKTIVLYGIKKLKHPYFHCISKLKTLLKTPFPTASDIAFSITPVLNSAGRMGEGTIASEFLLDSTKVSLENLKSINEERKKCANDTLESALKNARQYPNAIITKGQWNEGVLGIVAAKLAKRFQKCAFVLTNQASNTTNQKNILKGSVRGIGGVNIIDLLNGAQDILGEFGGHKSAAGVQLDEEKYEEFCKYLASVDIDYAKNEENSCDEFLLKIDSRDIDEELLHILEKFEPYGQGNPKPIFEATLHVESVEIIKEVHRKIIFSPLDYASPLDCPQDFNTKQDFIKDAKQDLAQISRQDSKQDTNQNLAQNIHLKAMYFFCEKELQKGDEITARFTLQRDSFSGKAVMIINEIL